MPFSAVKLCDSKCLLEIHTEYFFIGAEAFKSCLKVQDEDIVCHQMSETSPGFSPPLYTYKPL